MTLSELIQALVDQAQELNPRLVVNVDWLDDIEEDPEVRYAAQPNWPFEYAFNGPYLYDPMFAWHEEHGELTPEADDPDRQAWLDDRDLEQAKPKLIFLSESSQLGYLPSGAAEAVGWR
jgi:hypothetical protein